MVTLIIMVAFSMMPAKFATLAFLKLKILAHAIPSAAQLPRVRTRYSHDYTKPGSGQGRTRDAAPLPLTSYLLRGKQFEELKSKMMKNITYTFNGNGITFKNTIAKLLGEHTLNNDNSKKVRQKLQINFIDKTKNPTFFNQFNIVPM